MITILFNETPENTAIAMEAAAKLRAIGKKARMSNAQFFKPNDLENVEAVVAIDCPEVVEAYEARNEAIDLANERGDVRMFAGILKAKVVTDVSELTEDHYEDPDTDTDDKQFGGMTREMLAEHALSMLGLKLPHNMRKSEMVSAIRNGMANQGKPNEPASNEPDPADPSDE